MKNPKQIYEYFQAAFVHHLKKGGRGEKTAVAVTVGISNAYVSQLIRREKNEKAAFDVQVKIANHFGYDYLDFLNFGKGLVEGESNKKEKDSPELQDAIEDLRVIYESRDSMLIGAIRSNLTEFRRAADDRKKHAEEMAQMKKQMEAIQAQIDNMSTTKKPTQKRPNDLIYDRRKVVDRRKSKKA